MTLHEMGNIAGFEPVLVMDVWEHEFLLDYPRLNGEIHRTLFRKH
jgi:superoxide dismutase